MSSGWFQKILPTKSFKAVRLAGFPLSQNSGHFFQTQEINASAQFRPSFFLTVFLVLIFFVHRLICVFCKCSEAVVNYCIVW